MKLADCSPELLAELTERRYGTRLRKPADGSVWFNEQGVCSVCGATDDRTVMDHCHTTGFNRGWLCRGCNVHEGFHGGPLWDAWRLTAPLLELRERYVSSWSGAARVPFLTEDELATLPIADLLEVARGRRWDAQLAYSRLRSERVAAALDAAR